MTKKKKGVAFKTLEEYKAFYTADVEKQRPKGSKYYRIGAEIVKMACEQPAHTCFSTTNGQSK